MRRLDNITNSMDMNLSKLLEIVKDRGAWCAAVHGVRKNQTRLSNWTKLSVTKLRIAVHLPPNFESFPLKSNIFSMAA